MLLKMGETMARNKRKRKKTKQAQTLAPKGSSNPMSQTSKPSAPADEIDKLRSAAEANMTEADLKAIQSRPAQAPDMTIEELILKGDEALTLLEEQRRRSHKEEEQAARKSSALEKDRAALASERELFQSRTDEVDEKAKSVEAKEKELQELEQDLLKRQEDLIQREADADAGFAQRNKKALEALEQEMQDFRQEFSNHRSQIAAEREEWEKEKLERRSALQEECDSRRDKLDKALEQARASMQDKFDKKKVELNDLKEKLKAETKRLHKESRALEVEREILVEDRQAAEDRVEQLSATKLERRDAQIVALEERLVEARKERDELARRIADREAAEHGFGDQTPEELRNKLRKLRMERDKFRDAIGGLPGAEAVQRLEELERQRERWEVDRLRLLGEVSALKQDVANKRIAVTELEALRNHKDALKASNELLSKALEEEIQKINDLVRGTDGTCPFPSCAGMDNDNDLQSTRPTTDEIRSLKDFAEYVRHRMAYDPKTEKALYYSPEDARSFIAGLAMSKLHLLQGISGTGKTSLPLAFARAIGAGHALVEVQAGWRDRQDLIGHFNTFERRFYESEFLQALYRASCPQFRDTPFVVVLDEMNLSHPEQYFADLLSALEQEQQRQRLTLMTAPVEPSPSLLSEGGRKLQVPPNVWFVGTANHDETTKDFADKTYDRAHVMELPRHRDIFQPKDYQPMQPVGFEALQRAFAKAVKLHADAAETAYKFLEEHLGDILGGRFRVGWGNRLQRQMEDYVPLVIDCGGSIGEATDHVLATKLLRKIRDRHDNRPEDIIALRDLVSADWPYLDADTGPKKSLAILKEELHRLGHEED
jgi:hypothetical protein